MNLTAKIISDGTNICTVEKTCDGFENMTAVFVDAKTDEGKFFSPDCAVELTVGDISGVKRYLADYRYSPFWCRPFFGKELRDVPAETQTLLFEKNDGTYEILLATCGEEYKCTFLGDKWGLRARVYSWYDGMTECKTLAFVRGTGANPYELLHRAFKFAVHMLGDKIKMREDRPYPEIFEYLGWCSWDAFNIQVSEDKLLTKCREFKDKNIPIRWAILDDMWADVKEFEGKTYSTRSEMFALMHSSTLYSFEAAPLRFPNGLKHCIDEMKKYGIEVGMWHPTTGYWKGVTRGGTIDKEHGNALIERNGYLVPGTEYEQFHEFFDAFHSFFEECGASFVKVDNQSCIDQWYKGAAPVGKVASNMHKAIEKSVYDHSDGALINCMCMSSENMWNRPDTAVARCSNDFTPESREWFYHHISQCVFNCLTQGQLMWCDWDMWWTDDSQAIKNSVLRAISGGPIYVSDTAERSRRKVLVPLCLSDGRILRTDAPAVPTFDCIFSDFEHAEVPFKTWSHSGDTYYVAAFNINQQKAPVKGTVSVKDVNADKRYDRYFVIEQFTGEWHIVGKDETIDVSLENEDVFRLYKFIPIVNGRAIAGLDEKFISTLTVKEISDDGFTLAESGNFTFYTDKKPAFVRVGNTDTEFTYDGGLCEVKAPEAAEKTKVVIGY